MYGGMDVRQDVNKTREKDKKQWSQPINQSIRFI
jgi:hypothetical protein